MAPTPEQFQTHYFHADREQWRFAIVLWSVGVLIFLIIDFLLYGTSSSVYPLAMPRLVMILCSMLLWFKLPRMSYVVAERWVIAWVVLLCAHAIVHELMRPRDYFGHYPFQVLAVLVFFAAVPMAWIKQFTVIAIYFGAALVVLYVYKQPPTSVYFSSTTLLLLATLACGTLISLRMHRYRVAALTAHLKLAAQARTDSLTGVANRRAFMDRVALEVSRCAHEHLPLSILMIDIDNFKLVNDRFGHEEGDRLLRAFAGRMVESVRDGEQFARLGGEEFCLAISRCDLGEAKQFAERLRVLVREKPFVVGGQSHVVTVSIGVAQLRHDENVIDPTLRRADAALYRAKQGGRDRVEVTVPGMQAAAVDDDHLIAHGMERGKGGQ